MLAVSEGTFGGIPTIHYDFWRVENGKIAEHWDVMETMSDKESWHNTNGRTFIQTAGSNLLLWTEGGWRNCYDILYIRWKFLCGNRTIA